MRTKIRGDGLEGAKAALGGRGSAGEVDGQGLGFRACQRLTARQEDSGFGGSGAADPDRLESGVEHGIGVGDVDVVLGHRLGDLAEVALALVHGV